MLKAFFLVTLTLSAVSVFLVWHAPHPDTIEFMGHTLSSPQNNNNSKEDDLDILSYRDPSNHRILLLAERNGSKVSIEHLLQQYVGRFRFQGFEFTEQDNRWIGQRKNERLYATPSVAFDGIVIYVEKNAERNARLHQNAVFQNAEQLTFKR